VIEVQSLTKSFKSPGGDVTAVDDVSFTLAPGTFASIVGSSGSGKSTLLSLLGGLDKPSSGTVRVDDEVISAQSDHELIGYRRAKVGFVFQSFNLIPNLSALENVMLPMEFAKVDRSAREARATELLDQVGLLGEKQRRRPAKLSGGEQQRVAIARALANHPSVILADEPTGNLDSKTGRKIVDLLESLTADGTTVIVVTHDERLAERTETQFHLEDGRII